MPPKKAGGGSKKTEEKKKQKIIEDRTFGLKNKNKSKAVQKYVQSVTSQVKGTKSKTDDPLLLKKLKEEQKEKEKFEQSLFKTTVVQPKVPVGVDPKSVVCEFFKKGLCTKGDKCKYSHNLDIARKGEKRDIYSDARDAELENDTIDKWDQEKLEQVVDTKHGTSNQKNNKTKIVCKHFLDALESKKYGWFWECPGGGDKCIYQHCLPPGFVLKTKEKESDTVDEGPTIEEQIEEERAKLTKRTVLTLELFLKWKEEKKKLREEKEKEIREKRELDIKQGKALRSGREMFMFNPDLFVDEEDVMDTAGLEPEEEEEAPAIELSATGTSISAKVIRKGKRKEDGSTEDGGGEEDTGDEEEEDDDNNDQEDRGSEEEENGKDEEESEGEQPEDGASNGNGKSKVAVNEELFVEEDIPEDEE